MNWLAKATGIQGWMAEAELRWLQAAASNMEDVVEIGAWKGRSTVALAAGAKRVFSVDTFKGSPDELETTHAEAKTTNIFDAFIENTKELENVVAIVGESTKSTDRIGKDKVDMVFVDGQHTTEAVSADIEAWLPHCSKIICGHDFNFPSVREAVLKHFDRRQVIQGPGAIWYVDLTVPIDKRDAIAVCLPGPNFSRAWFAQWNELFIHLFRKFRVCLFYAESNNIYQVRNIVAKSVLSSPENPKYVLWIDSDNLVSVQGFEELLASISECPEVDAVGAWYRFFGPNGTLIAAGTGPDLRPTEEQIANLPGLLQVGYIGFGFLLMRIEMLKAMGEKAFLPYLDNGEFCTDDGGFCDRAREKGFKFFLHPRVFAPHLKLGEVSAIRPISQT